ncbi:hypothetical protein BATDEDRAFT_88907 [Batrachochytrium dendrobatidis JAM81]|uniref:Uncharacterized protein n=1 Tax=Batrachochytrium dendrobatidis (strain JAM81 / FGSC 10211) TaxID=684364 RepID=F4P3Q8_BATDJ|nr:uncharacterized protein BATDEDRAFT_88907 [Batrachochytrium dendrobatidis JAM81]EGF80124.1 hypothetical protein BATDEDRAFT_88907 [Batrachochytrium dendrobatidis JAM81]KAJ8326608.1 hypothetical protein O5D80_005341 [Batrachochytrium dendrobatidis]KAK5666609.1 hypothetical protein QVD99_006679 [Batrachochytrium dendrobatidis]|eukprot:XP_006679177.1 hypothetical protein BATDEDRAFT_88907 [Batrachochytrium dendrobatidis JAM81]
MLLTTVALVITSSTYVAFAQILGSSCGVGLPDCLLIQACSVFPSGLSFCALPPVGPGQICLNVVPGPVCVAGNSCVGGICVASTVPPPAPVPAPATTLTITTRTTLTAPPTTSVVLPPVTSITSISPVPSVVPPASPPSASSRVVAAPPPPGAVAGAVSGSANVTQNGDIALTAPIVGISLGALLMSLIL